MASYVPGTQPVGWVPYPPGGMPYYMAPSLDMGQKDSTVVSISPPYSPPHSPPPPTELSTEQRQAAEAGAPMPRTASPRPSYIAYSETTRFQEGPF